MSNGNGHHWSKFFWRDWSADKALHPCSLAAKGFWIELLCIMHEGTPVGHLTLGGKPATNRQMAANAYCSERDAAKYLAELETAGVFSRTIDGTIYCRRMVNDGIASSAGREYAEKRWNGHRPNGPPNGSPNGVATGNATGQPYGTPNAKNLEGRSKKEPPRRSPANGGPGTPAEPGTPPARRADFSNPRAVGTNLRETGENPRAWSVSPRQTGDNPRRKPSRNAFHDLGREFEAEMAERIATIDGNAEEVADLQAFRQRIAGGSRG